MGVKVKWSTKKDGFPAMLKGIKAVSGKFIEVGAFHGEHAWLAGIHEYGLDIEVTPKMRAYLHYHGLHLHPDTTHIHIPERSFLRAGYDENKKEVLNHAKRLAAAVAAGRLSADDMFDMIGTELADMIKDYATDLDSPGNHGFTIGNKGSSNPLVDTGDMIGGIDWRMG